jgi:hypothetical protein
MIGIGQNRPPSTAPIARHGQNHNTGNGKRVDVVVSNKYATPEQEAEALLQALGFTKDDQDAYKEKYKIDLKAVMTAEFTSHAKRGRTNYHVGKPFGPTVDYPKGGYKTSITVSEHHYKVLTDFIKERRSPKQEAIADDIELTKQYKMQELRNQGAMRRAQIEKNQPVVGGMTAALPNTVPLAPVLPNLPKAASVVPLMEALPPVLIVGSQVAPVGVVAWELGTEYVEARRAAERKALEAAGLAELVKTVPPPPLIFTEDGSKTKTKDKIADTFKPAPGGPLVPVDKGKPATTSGTGTSNVPRSSPPLSPQGPNKPDKPTLPDLTGPAIGLATAAAGKKLVDLYNSYGEKVQMPVSLVKVRSTLNNPEAIKSFDQRYKMIWDDPVMSEVDKERKMHGYLETAKQLGNGDLEKGLIQDKKDYEFHRGLNLPYGTSNRMEFGAFGQKVREGLQKAGVRDGQAYLQGSAITGIKYTSGEIFDVGRTSDWDLAISSPSLFAKLQQMGAKVKGGSRIGPLTTAQLEKLGLIEVVHDLKQKAGRDVFIMVYKTPQDLKSRNSQSIYVP